MGTLTKTTRAIIGLFTGSDASKPDTTKLKPLVSLQKYLTKAYKKALSDGSLGDQPADDSTVKLHVPISIIALAKSGNQHPYAGIHDDEMHFSASLLKVAALFSAYSLRSEARALAASQSFANPTAFFTALAAQFHSTDAVPAIQSKGVGLNPRYKDILTVTGTGSLQVEFKPDFFTSVAIDHPLFEHYQTVHEQEVAAGHIREDQENAVTNAALAKCSHMYLMIVPSNNQSAGECIRRLGYAYINVKLMNAGFFAATSTPPSGIWLAGDYVGAPRVEVDSLNDDKSAAATTSRAMARFFSQIDLKQLIPITDAADDNNAQMKALLSEAQTTGDSAFVSRFGPRLFDVEGVKIGLANLKPNTPPLGENVYSEGLLLKWQDADADKLQERNLNGQLAVCWQNMRAHATNDGIPAIAKVIETAFSDYINQAPL